MKEEEKDSRYLAMEFKYSMLTLIGWLLGGYHKEKEVPVISSLKEDYLTPEELLPNFLKNLRLNINNGTLPYLLQRLNIDRYTKKGSIQMSKPNLSDLFDLPLKAAEKEFIKKYGNYQLTRYPKDPGFMQAVGIQRKSMKQKINKI